MEEEEEKELDAQKRLVELIAHLTGDTECYFHLEVMNFQDYLCKIGCNIKNIKEEQYKELTNVLQQLRKMLEDYIKENNIELGGE